MNDYQVGKMQSHTSQGAVNVANSEMMPHRIVRASAGAGKTYQLTVRYLMLLRAGTAADEILATTFTRKAAGEILGRVLGRLAKAVVSEKERAALSKDLAREALHPDLGKPVSESECLGLLRALTAKLHRLNISTLDSFFQRVASSFRFELGLPVDPVVTDEGSTLAKHIRMQAIEAMLGEVAGRYVENESAEGDMQTLLRLLKELHHDAAKRSVTEAIDNIVVDLYGLYREVPDQAKWSMIAVGEEMAGRLDESALQASIQRLEGLVDYLPMTKTGKPNGNWLKAWDKSVFAARRGDWLMLAGSGLVKAVCDHEKGGKFYGKELEGEVAAVYELIGRHVRAEVARMLHVQTLATYQLLKDFDRHYVRIRDQHGVVLFSDITHKLSRYLPAQDTALLTEMYYRLDGQVKHLLLDEFQDTSREQWAVLEPMAEEMTAWTDGALSRSFFCVGDTKQAIYGWRGGYVGLFDQVEALPGLDDPQARMRLDMSFRSSQVVLDAVNQVFDGLAGVDVLDGMGMTKQAWEGMFDSHKAGNKELPGYVELISSRQKGNHQSDDQDDSEFGPSDEHEVFVAEKIKFLAAKHPDRSIGVLVNRNSTVNRLLFELQKLGIKASGEGGSSIANHPAVAAILSALMLADHAGDTVAAFHVLNSPVGQVLAMKEMSPSTCERISNHIRDTMLRVGMANTLARWGAALTKTCDDLSMRRLEQLVGLAERYEQEHQGAGLMLEMLRLSRFVSYIQTVRVEDASVAQVRVMTLHQSKGLEFDVVVMAELDQGMKFRWPAVVLRDSQTDEVRAVFRSGNDEMRLYVNAVWAAFELKKQEQWREELCKLYVGMTRAKHALHMIVKEKKQKKSGSSASGGSSFAAVLCDTLANDADDSSAPDRILYAHGDGAWDQSCNKVETAESFNQQLDDDVDVVGQLHSRLQKADDDVARSWVAVSPSSLESAGTVRAEELLSIEVMDDSGRQFGTLVHEWFSVIGFWGEDDGEGLVTGVEGMTDERLLVVADDIVNMADAEMLEKAIAFRRIFEKQAVREVLSRRANGEKDELWRERRFAVRIEGGKLMRGAFDRVVVHRDRSGQVKGATLIDFKTDRVEKEGDVEQHMATYRPQVEAYRGALVKMLGIDREDVRVKLVFTGKGIVQDVD
ncbi:UvrD-helicase domain-containing protein [Poriferisphaera sp. WC338]|uniref:UvrD-helicase domain-containing protein n=1 Tax=Poriferisphaera sp. WC338 TaxID=3425129 RepID=UPI003D8186AA